MTAQREIEPQATRRPQHGMCPRCDSTRPALSLDGKGKVQCVGCGEIYRRGDS